MMKGFLQKQKNKSTYYEKIKSHGTTRQGKLFGMGKNRIGLDKQREY